MPTMKEHLERYLAQREAFGTGLSYSTVCGLKRFTSFATVEDQSYVTAQLFLRWKEQSEPLCNNSLLKRLSDIRVFARWLQSLEPLCEVPPLKLISGRDKRSSPYISSDEEITKLVTSAFELPSASGLRGPTCSTLFGLLSVTGLRLGEALGLDDGDVDTEGRVLHVKHGKNGPQRVLPITSCTAERLSDDKNLRDNILGMSTEQALFRSWKSGQRLPVMTVEYNFVRLSQVIGLREKPSDGGY